MLLSKNSRVDGFAVFTGEYGEIIEMDTLKCGHCQAIVIIPRKGDTPGGICGHCKEPICEACYKIGKCTPFMRALEKAEEKDLKRRTRGY